MQQQVNEIVAPVLAQTDGVFGQSYSALLYGSAAREEFVPGFSDVNLLLVCDALPPATLRRLAPAFLDLQRHGHPPPFLIERVEWSRAADVFPIEVTDMRAVHQLLRGSDPVAGLSVTPAELRRALEQEFRARLLRLRRIYALHSGDAAALGQAAVRTVSSVAALLRAAIALTGKAAPLPTPGMLAAAEAAFGIPTEAIAALWKARGEKSPRRSAEEFEGYLSAVTTAVRVIDQFSGGAT